jgi:hypothetical protein
MDDSLARHRRMNALALFQAHAERAVAGGAPPKGLEQAFAAALEISPSMWSQIKSSRPIGDRLARQIEHHCRQAAGWLDEEHAVSAPDPAEDRFVELARRVWRGRNAKGKRELTQWLRQQESDEDLSGR